jgi:hypothetical protein
MPTRALARLLGVASLVLVASAHVGSPDTWFQGNAGPYPVRAVIRLPGVIPGLAQIDITVSGDGVQQVTAQPVIFDAGTGGAPPADIAEPVAGRPGAYHAELWFMQPGSFSVHIAVHGTQGEGTVVIPVAAVAERQIPLYPWLGWILSALGILLFVGAVTIVRAAATDGVTAPGASPPPGATRKGTMWAVLGGAVICLGLLGARSWWLGAVPPVHGGGVRGYRGGRAAVAVHDHRQRVAKPSAAGLLGTLHGEPPRARPREAHAPVPDATRRGAVVVRSPPSGVHGFPDVPGVVR